MPDARLHFEDVPEGRVFPLGPYEMTREAILKFASAFDPQPFHLDEEAARQSVLGGLAASGWHTSAAMLRMICDAFLTRAHTLGSAGIEEMKWLKPVYVGDVLAGDLTITSVRRSSSKPGLGIVSYAARVSDQHGTAKAQMKSMVFIAVRQP